MSMTGDIGPVGPGPPAAIASQAKPFDILQGHDMGVPSRLHADIPAEQGASIRVSGEVRVMRV